MSLSSGYTFVGKGNWSLDASGGSATGGGTITASVPIGSTVVKAVLYETTFSSASASSVTLTSGAASTIVSSASFTGLGSTVNLQAYRADVTSYVSSVIGSGSASTFSFTTSGVGNNVDGYVLAIVFSNPSEAERTIVLADGFSATTGDSFAITFPDPVDTDVAGFEALLSLGIGFSFQTNGSQQFSRVDVNGERLTTSAGGEDDGSAANGGLVTVGGIGDSADNPAVPTDTPTNPRSDDELYDLADGFITDGATSLTINTLNPSNNDNIFFAGFNILGKAIIDTGGNDAPFAVNDSFTTDAGGLTNASVLGNDEDPDGDTLVVSSFTPSPGFEGLLTFNADGTFNYDPDGFVGVESFTYTISDPDGLTATATVTLTVEGDDPPPPIDCPTVDRDGTQDGSASTNDILVGPAYHNTFYFDTSASSGDDRITNFAKDDIIVTSEAIFDSNSDGIIKFGGNGIIDLGGGDTIRVDGVPGSSGLRFMGEFCPGSFVYAAASVRPKNAIEGKFTDDVLAGDASDARANRFFFDTALDLDLGDDTINSFGMKDILVTTTAIQDKDGDGRIAFGGNKLLDLPGGINGPGDPDPAGAGGSVRMFDTGGAAMSMLEFDGQVVRDGVTYYVYSHVGSSAGVSTLGF